ncbi:Hint domain-containing protein, partial [Roseomonas elaeocarpi]
VHAETLINGATVVQEEVAEVEYFHVELDAHDVMVAEGAAAESFLDTGNRARFDNAAVVQLHPDFGGVPLASARPDPALLAGACAPHHREGAVWQAVAADVLARAEALGWRREVDGTAPWLTDERGRVLRADASDDVAGAGAVTYRFALPRDAVALRLCSGALRPAALRPGEEDRRSLGLAVSALSAVDARGQRRAVPLDHVDLRLGWHGVEDADGTPWRWTDGAALIPPSMLRDAVALEVTVAQRMPRWIAP